MAAMPQTFDAQPNLVGNAVEVTGSQDAKRGSWPAKQADYIQEPVMSNRASNARQSNARQSHLETIRQSFVMDGVQPTCWERFLAGEIGCPCLGFAAVFVVMLVWIAFGVKGAKFNTESDGTEVLTDAVLKLWYSHRHIKLNMCRFGAHNSNTVRDSNECGVSRDDRRLAADEFGDDDMHELRSLMSEGMFAEGPPRWPVYSGLSFDWSGSLPRLHVRCLQQNAAAVRSRSRARVSVVYEAEGTGCPGSDCKYNSKSVLQEKYLRAIKTFESSVWGETKFQSDFCNVMYPFSDDNSWHHLFDHQPYNPAVSTGKCVAPGSLNQQIYFTDQAAMKTLLDQNFGSILAKCVCTSDGGACSTCISVAAKSIAASCVQNELSAAIQRLPAHKQSGEHNFKEMSSILCRGVSSDCDSMDSMPSSNDAEKLALASALLTKMCEANPGIPCSYSAPARGSLCWTVAWSYTTASTQISAADRQTLLSKMCDLNAPEFGLSMQYLPTDVCQGTPPGANLVAKGSPLLKSGWSAGAPLEYGGSEEVNDQLKDAYAGDLMKTYLKAKKQMAKETDGELRPILFASMLLDKQIIMLLVHDGSLAVASFILVFIYMWFSTESFFLSACGMWEIIMSIPPAMGVWSVLNGDGMTSLQFLTIYMILGIGADDVFVLLDAWKQARHALQGKASPVQIFAVGYRRAFFAMFTTTLTTGSAFLFGAFCSIPMVSHFCVFAAIVVFFDFIWCVTFFSSAICVYERFFEGRKCCCAGKAPPPGQCGGPGCCWGLLRCCWTKCNTQSEGGRQAGGDERFIEKLFGETIYKYVRLGKFVLLAWWTVVIIGAGVSAGVGVKNATKPPDIGKQSHDLVRYVTLHMNYWTQWDPQQLYVGWGLEADYATKYTSENPITPEVKFATNFANSITTEAGQQKVLDLCRSPDVEANLRCASSTCLVRGHPSAASCQQDAYIWRNDKFAIPQDQACESGRYCFMEWVKEYAENHASPTLSFPVPQAQFIPLLKSTAFKQYLANREEKLYERKRYYDVDMEKKMTGWVIEGNDLKFAWIGFNVTYSERPTNTEANEVFDKWDALVEKYAAGTNGHKTAEMFNFMVTQNRLVSSAVTGIFTSLAVAFVVLVIVTQNIIIGLIGLANISFITVTFVGLMPILGWELGTRECIFLIAVVGLSVDYSVHMLHAYNEHKGAREDKLQLSLQTMGISVFSGAATTLMAALPLAMCKMKFFEQYGFFIFFVCLFSFVLAVGLLPPLLLIFGPQGNCGNVCFCFKSGERASLIEKE